MAAASRGTVCELRTTALALVVSGLPPRREAKNEKVLACANIGAMSIRKEAQPAKRLRNKGFMSFFVKKRLRNEEVLVL
jgi:hypothetical protein